MSNPVKAYAEQNVRAIIEDLKNLGRDVEQKTVSFKKMLSLPKAQQMIPALVVGENLLRRIDGRAKEIMTTISELQNRLREREKPKLAERISDQIRPAREEYNAAQETLKSLVDGCRELPEPLNSATTTPQKVPASTSSDGISDSAVAARSEYFPFSEEEDGQYEKPSDAATAFPAKEVPLSLRGRLAAWAAGV